MLVRESTTAAGSAGAVPNSASGTGSSQGTSVRAAPGVVSASCAGAPSPDGSGLRPRVSSARRHALVAIRYSQVRMDERPSNPP